MQRKPIDDPWRRKHRNALPLWGEVGLCPVPPPHVTHGVRVKIVANPGCSLRSPRITKLTRPINSINITTFPIIFLPLPSTQLLPQLLFHILTSSLPFFPPFLIILLRKKYFLSLSPPQALYHT